MKALFLKMLVSSFVLFEVATLHAQEVERLLFAEKFSDSEPTLEVQSILPKEERLSSVQRGVINMIMSDDIPDSVRICANVAAELWQPYLNNKYPIQLAVYYTDFDTDNDIQVEVSYYQNENVYYPISLYSYLYDVDFSGQASTADALIYINKATAWDCSYHDEVNTSTRSLTYAMMRAIAISLGFGSSVTQKSIRGEDIIAFGYKEGHSAFDNFIFSSEGKFLKDISNVGNHENQELSAFAQPATDVSLYALKQDAAHKLYAPANFEVYKSLVYLDNEKSLMHYDLKTGTKQFRIDDTTVELLDAIGWETNAPKDVEIVGQGIDDTGLASAYDNHHFVLQNHNGGAITNAQWTYILPMADGKDSVISKSEGNLVFDIEAIEDETQFQINMNGDISGQIVFTGTINGKEVEDVFYLSLELKPRIKEVNILKKESNYPLDSYDLYYTVEYVGSDHLFIQVEEEYGVGMESQFVYEPFFAHVVSKYITAPFYNWVDIKAENEYGEDIYTIELPPYAGNGMSFIANGKSERKSGKTGYSYIEVFNEHGNNMGHIRNLEDLHSYGKGLYILKFYVNNVCVKTTKYLKS